MLSAYCITCQLVRVKTKRTQCAGCRDGTPLEQRKSKKIEKLNKEAREASAYEALATQVFLIQECQKGIRAEMLESPSAARDLSQKISNLANALSKVNKELVAYDRDEMQDLQTYSFPDWLREMSTWFGGLSRQKQSKVLQNLYDIHYKMKDDRPGPKAAPEQDVSN